MDINTMPRPDECVELVVTADSFSVDHAFEFVSSGMSATRTRPNRIRMYFRLPRHSELPDHEVRHVALTRHNFLLRSAFQLDFNKDHRVSATINHVVFDAL